MTTRTGRPGGPNQPGPSTPAAPGVAPRIVFIAAAAALGGFLFGYDSAVINGAVTGIQHDFNVGSGTTGFIVAAALPGAAAGAIAGGWMADRIGRIRAMQIAAVLFTISGVGSMFAFQPWDLTIWRILGGFAIGIASVIGPAYIAEVSPPAFRGRLTSFQQLAIVLGIAISALVNYLINLWAGGTNTDHLGGLAAWRWMLGAEVVPAIVYGVLSTMIPESPRFLVAIGDDDRARKVLAEVEGTHANVADRIAEIREQLAGEVKPKLADLLTPSRKNLLAVVWIGIGLSVLQQFVGINVIFYYSSLLWQSVGIDTSNSLLISMISAAVNIAGTVVAMALVDRIGRRPLLLIGSVGMAVTLGLCAWMFSYGTPRQRQDHAAQGAGRHGAARRERLRVLLRDVLGRRGVGAARRDVPEPDPGAGAVRRGQRAVAGELAGDGLVPVAVPLEPGRGVLAVRDRRGDLHPLRVLPRPRNEGKNLGIHGLGVA